MTISTTNNRNDYTASASQTTFAYTFPVTVEGDIEVYVDTVLKTISTDYTVSATPAGNVVFGTPLAGSEKVALVRNVTASQAVDYVANDPFPAETHESALDKLTMICQQLGEKLGRAITLSASSTSSDLTIPEPSADQYLAWNSGATALENKDITSISAISLPVPIASGGTAATSASAARTSLGLGDAATGDVGSEIQAYDANNALTDVAQEFTATQNFNATTLTSTTNAVAWVASTNQVVTHTLTENTTFSAPSGLVDGAFYSLCIVQDASASSFTVAFNSVFKFTGGAAPTWTTTANARDYITFRSNGTNLYEVGHSLAVS